MSTIVELTSVAASTRVFEIDGLVTRLLLITHDDGYVQLDVHVDKEHMLVGAPTELGGTFDLPYPIVVGKPIGIRSFFVPVLNANTGVVEDRKRYSVAKTLADCTTAEQGLAADYKGKPPVATANEAF